MRRDPEKALAWKRRSQEKQREKARHLPRTPMPRENRERKAKLKLVQFGPQAALCRGLPCCACHPELFTDELLALEHYTSARQVSQPHHSPAVGSGGTDRDTSPLCDFHHKRLDSPGNSEKSVQRECGVNFRRVAALLYRNLRGNYGEAAYVPVGVPESAQKGTGRVEGSSEPTDGFSKRGGHP